MGRDRLARDRASGQVLVHRSSRRFARRHGVDQQPRAVRQIARDEHARCRGGQRGRVYFRPARPKLLDIRAAVCQESQIRSLAHRQQHRVAGHRLPHVVGELGGAIPFCRAMLAGNGVAFEAEACGRLADIHGCAIS